MRITKKMRSEIKQKFGGKCAYCGVKLGDKWHADHVKTVLRGKNGMERPENHNMDNIFPSCVSCNLHKGGWDLDDWRENIERAAEICSSQTMFKTAMRVGKLLVSSEPVVFYFERVKDGDL